MNTAERIKRTIEKQKFPKERTRYELLYDELCYFHDLIYAGNVWDGITEAFDYGFIEGMRYQKAQEKKRKNAPATDQSTQGAKQNTILL